MRRQSEAERTRRARRSELFKARLCLHDCGRPAAPGQNICQPCDDALVAAYNARMAQWEKPIR